MYQPAATDPIVSRLRPRSVPEVLDAAFRLYRRHFLTFLAITAVVYVPIQLAGQLINASLNSSTTLQRSTLQSTSFSDPGYTSQSNALVVFAFVVLGVALLVLMVQRMVLSLGEGALTSAVADSYLDKPISFGGAYRSMFRRIGPLLGLIALQVLIYVGMFLPLILVFVFSILSLTGRGDSGGAALAICGLGLPLTLVSFIAFFYIAIRLSVVVPAVMIENLTPRQAIRRSWRLVQNYWWRTLGLQILLAFFSYIISAGPAALLLALLTAFTRSLDPFTITIITAVATVALSALYIPLQLTSTTLYYFDLRVRKEGFDIEQAMERRYWPHPPSPLGHIPGPAVYLNAPQTSQYAPAGGVAPPTLGYAPGPQAAQQPYPAQAYPQQPYSAQPAQPTAESYAPGPTGAATLPIDNPGTPPSGPSLGLGDAAPGDAPAHGVDFATPSISEQAQQRPEHDGDDTEQNGSATGQ